MAEELKETTPNTLPTEAAQAPLANPSAQDPNHTNALAGATNDEPIIREETGGEPVVQDFSFDISKVQEKDGLRKMDKNVVICRDLNQLKGMFTSHNIMKGVKPMSEEERSKAAKKYEPQIFRVPKETFDDFDDLHEHNEDLFEYMATQVIISYLEECCLHLTQQEKEGDTIKWDTAKLAWNVAIEFPEVIGSTGRSKLHEIGNYFDLAHHSTGTKGKSRKTVLYPRTLFTDKQESERSRLENEKYKIYEKYQTREAFSGEPSTKPLTFREQVMREIWEEKFAPEEEKTNTKYVTTNMLKCLDKNLIGQVPDHVELHKLIIAKKKEMETMNQNLLKKQQRAEETLKKYEEYERTSKETEELKAKDQSGKIEKKADSDDDGYEHLRGKTGQESEEEELDEETKAKIKKDREENAKKIKEYQDRLKKETLQTFKDVPDEINRIYLNRLGVTWCEISWDAPESNNSTISHYNIFLGSNIIGNAQVDDGQ